MSFLAGVFALIQAVPYLYKAFGALVLLYVEAARASHNREILNALQKALDEGDQRDLENAIGSGNAGKPASDQTDVVVRPRRPRRPPAELSVVLLLLLGACVSREKVEADIWLVEPLPARLCSEYPEVRQYGFFRVVDCNKAAERQGLCFIKPDCEKLSKAECQRLMSYEELVPFCGSSAGRMIAMREADAKRWLSLLTRKKD